LGNQAERVAGIARRLEDLGCVIVMPIGSGCGVMTLGEIEIIIKLAEIPIVVDAGLGMPSEAASVMEVVNTANAMEADLALTGEGCKLGVDAGRMAYQVGRIPAETYSASPHEGVPEATPERLINASVVAA